MWLIKEAYRHHFEERKHVFKLHCGSYILGLISGYFWENCKKDLTIPKEGVTRRTDNKMVNTYR
jgi:hypothetical protein